MDRSIRVPLVDVVVLDDELLNTPAMAKMMMMTRITTRPMAIVNFTFFHHMALRRLRPVLRKTCTSQRARNEMSVYTTTRSHEDIAN